MVCPNYKNKQVRAQFNEIVSALGGRPMTEQEFASAELRNLRSGRDYSAMEATYRIWNLNNGNPIDYTPDMMGETKSILFLNLLESFNGDRDAAIRAKSQIYSKLFKNWFDKSKRAWDVVNNSGRSGLFSDMENDALAKINPDFIAYNNAIRKLAIKFGRVPMSNEINPADVLKDAGLDKYVETEYFAVDVKEDVQFDLSDKYDDAQMDLAKLNKKHPELNLKFETVNLLNEKGKDFIKDFAKQDLSLGIYDDLSALNLVSKEVYSISNMADANGEPSIEALTSFLDEKGIKFLAHNLVIGERGAKSMPYSSDLLKLLEAAKEVWRNAEHLSGNERVEKMRAIKSAYLWELGVDGKWRYETLPIKFKDYKFKINMLRKLKERNSIPIVTSLGDVVDLGRLPLEYANELQSAELVILFSNSSKKGLYLQHDGKHAFLLNLLNDSPISTITHEIQHYVQYKEGFLQGGSPEEAKVAYLKHKGIYDAYKMLKLLKEEHSEELEDREMYQNLYEELEKTIPSSYEAYRRLVGEAEARAVASRDVNLDYSGRRQTLISDTIFDDVAEEDLIFLQDIQSNVSALTKADFSQTFGNSIYDRLLSGEQVSTQELLEVGMADTEVFHGNLLGVAKILQKHNVPVMIAEGLTEGTVATTMTDEDGNSVIMIDPDWINTVSKQRQGEILIHEIIHAVTANALNAPKTAIESSFKSKTYKLFGQLKKAVRNEDWHLFDVYGGLYALCDVHEFVSEFISNPIARSNIYALAKEIDAKGDKKILNRLKAFVNAFFRLFINRDLFSLKTTVEQLRQYESYLQDYLNGVNPISNTKKFTKKELIDAYHNIDEVSLNNDKISILKDKLHKGMIAVQKHNVKLGWALDTEDKKDLPIKDKYNWIRNSLQSRINAIQTSRLPLDTKTVLMSETKGWLDQMNNPQVTTYEAFSQFLNALGPRIIAALDELDNLKFSNNISSDYMYQAHDNIGTFDAILRDVSVILKNESEVQDIVTLFNELNKENPITKEHLAELQTAVEELSGLLSTAKGMITNIRNRVAITAVSDIVKDAGSIEGMEMIQNMISKNPVIEQDVSWFLVQFGLADASPNEIVRAVAHIIQKANDRVDDLTLDKAIKLIKLVDDLKDGESVLDLYETVNGKRTGFLVRPFNYGKYRDEYADHLAKINEKFGLPAKNTTPPTDEMEAIEWEMARQEFLSKYAEQRYTPEYYKAWAGVPRHVKELIGKLNGAMIAILQKYDAIDKDGTRHYEKITDDEDWKQFLSLKMSKKLMRETHDRFGNEKQGTDLQDALTLQNVYKKLYGSEYKQMKTKKKQWNDAREEIIKQCGGHAELKKYLNDEESSFDFKTFDKWESRNSKRDFKRNASGKPIIFEDLEQELQGQKIDYGEEYRKLKERERSLLRPIYDVAGEPIPYLLEDSVKNILRNEIYPRMSDIRKEVIKATPGYAKLAENSKRAFDAFFKFVDTRYYKQIQSDIAEETMEDDEFAFSEDDYEYALADYGYLYEDEGFTYVIPYKWYQTLVAQDDDYMEMVPNEAWLEPDDLRSYDNPAWKEQGLDKIGLSVVPKQELYKNELWNKIENSPTLKALYDEIVSTMHEANEMLSNRLFTNDYLLPGVSAKLLDRLKLVKGIDKLTTFLKWVCEKLGINVGQDQDVLLRGETTAHDETNEEGETIFSLYTRTIGRRGDGREYTALPQYFTRRLDNPEFTSGALLDIVLSYYKMSVNYSEKSKIKDTCDAILDYVKDREYYPGMSQRTVDGVKKYLNTKGADSTEMTNVYKQLSNLIDFGLYGKVKIQFKTKWFDINRIVDVTRQLTTATNLGMNKKVAAVGFMTAMHAHIVNSLLGKEYKFMQIVDAGIEVVKHLIYNLFRHGLYSRKSTDLMQVIMEEMGVAQQLERKMTDLDFSSNRIGELLRMVKQNYVFGYLSTIDYLTKSQITLSTLKNYKYIDGKIYSSLDIEYMLHDKKEYKRLLKEYNKAKSIYEYMKVKDGRIHFEDAGMNSAWKKEFSRIKAKCVKMSERADGVATGLQRAAIQNSWIGMIIMIHRQFLPLMLQERYGDRVYDYDTQEYKNGQFRVLFKYLSELMMNNFLVGAPTAMIALSFWISNPAWILAIGTILATGTRIYGKINNQHKSVKQINKEMFGTFDDLKSTINSVENKYALKLIAIERAMITLISTFLINPVCKWADDDKDDFWLLTFAYWLKGSQWEINGPYNIEELVANIKSPTAMTSLLDRFNAVAANNNSGILNWLSSLSLTEEDDKVINNNSPYAGWTHTQRSWFKALSGPISNEYEQDKSMGAYTKRKWIERQNFHEHAGDNKDVFELIRNLFNAFSEWFE